MNNTPTPETDAIIRAAMESPTMTGTILAAKLTLKCQELERELAEAREQRDRLAEALRPFIDGWSDKSCDSIVTEQQFRDARKALAAVKELAK
jgi:hypothetical protein